MMKMCKETGRFRSGPQATLARCMAADDGHESEDRSGRWAWQKCRARGISEKRERSGQRWKGYESIG